METDRIKRLHFVDLDIALFEVSDGEMESLDAVIAELTTGLNLQHTQLEGGETSHPAVRFAGSRESLEQLLARYDRN